MNIEDFDFHLPNELIAQYPSNKRTESKLIIANGLKNEIFANIIDYLNPNDLLVFNDTKVIPARLFATKESSGKLEVMLDRITSETTAIAMIKASRAPKIGSNILFDENNFATVVDKDGAFYTLECNSNIFDLTEKLGHIPLPPYIKRSGESADENRYQSVFAKNKGAVAAPTASLHFDNELLEKIKNKGVKSTHLTLHVGSGTFAPIKTDNIKEHKMHYEYFNISEQVIKDIKQVKKNGGRVIAVGTTVVRVLETVFKENNPKPQSGETNIFIYPPYDFKAVDCLITNFHLPKSTLLMLVSALVGVEKIKELYEFAVQNNYRFFSYGDAMLLERNKK